MQDIECINFNEIHTEQLFSIDGGGKLAAALGGVATVCATIVAVSVAPSGGKLIAGSKTAAAGIVLTGSLYEM